MSKEWDDSLSIGIKEIDEQHERFIGILNIMRNRIGSDDRKEIKKVLLDLIDYAIVHFRTEERYFDKFDYKGSAKHRNEHLLLNNKLSGIYYKFEKEGKEIDKELVNFLEEWLANHIETEDKEFGNLFRGLSEE